LFASEEFLTASEKFVCIRIETYENKEAEEKVRALLNGRYANTAFCLFDPQGESRLTRSGRGPTAAFSNRGRDGEEVDAGSVARQMNQIAARFKPNRDQTDFVLQDFNSFRQALNVASADQRLLVCVNVEDKHRKNVESNLREVFADEEVSGKFHLDFLDPDADKAWSKSIRGKTNQPGILIVRSGKFGLDGAVMATLSHSNDAAEIKSALLDANEKYSNAETRKQYAQHVQSGKRQGVYFENEISREGTSDQPRQNRNRKGRRGR
jgi:hypothetical protein